MFRWFAERTARREAAEKIYDSIVAQSRNPVFYVRCGVPDTLSGRFDTLVIHMFIVMQNLKLGANEGKLLGKEIIEAFVREMDSMVRDLGISDVYVAQEVRKIADLFYRQLVVYTNAVEQKNATALAEAIWKSFQSGDENADVAADELASYIFQAIKNIGEMPLNLLLQGHLNFPEIYG
ncbi:MAG: ubiquinol-cytochrome C chaperone family protein, partial [Rhodomicrobium sp.]